MPASGARVLRCRLRRLRLDDVRHESPRRLTARGVRRSGRYQGFLIESFESSTLLPGLTVDFDGLYQEFPLLVWDGTREFEGDIIPNGIQTFTYAPGALSVGFGVGDIEGNKVAIVVNGRELGLIQDIPHYARKDNQREIYVRIDSEPGDVPITSFGLKLVERTDQNVTIDWISYDRLAIRPVPEPASAALALLGAGLFSRAVSTRRQQLRRGRLAAEARTDDRRS